MTTAKTPEECDELFELHLNAGHLEGLVALYEPRAVLVQQDRSIAAGPDAIREALAGLVAMKAHVEMNVVRTVPSGDDLAVCYNDWKMTLTGPDGTPTEARGKAIELCRRQRDGTWKYVLDDPWARG